jgi:hypothetical protein
MNALHRLDRRRMIRKQVELSQISAAFRDGSSGARNAAVQFLTRWLNELDNESICNLMQTEWEHVHEFLNR